MKNKLIQHWDDLKGNTIEEVINDHGTLYLRFVNGMFAILEGILDYDYSRIYLVTRGPKSIYGCPDAYVQIGLISQEEFNKAVEENDKKYTELEEARERQVYVELKKKFEP